MKRLIILLIVTAFIACNNEETKTASEAATVITPGASKNTEAFNESFRNLLTSYYAVKDALVDYDTVKANAASLKLAVYADSLKVDEISEPTGKLKQTAKDYAGTITGSALALAGETQLPDKKKEFSLISEAMYELVKSVRYDREKIYHQHCPMALNDNQEAYWLSNNGAVVNPYLGKKHPKYRDAMLACGDVTDSIDFSK